jgi:hypothetical protein
LRCAGLRRMLDRQSVSLAGWTESLAGGENSFWQSQTACFKSATNLCWSEISSTKESHEAPGCAFSRALHDYSGDTIPGAGGSLRQSGHLHPHAGTYHTAARSISESPADTAIYPACYNHAIACNNPATSWHLWANGHPASSGAPTSAAAASADWYSHTYADSYPSASSWR